MANERILMGNISANSIQLPIYQVTLQNSINNLSITYDNLKINQPTSFMVLVNDEVYYPDIKWNSQTVTLEFGQSLSSGTIIKIVK